MNITLKNIEHTERTSKAGKPFTSCRLTTYSQKLQKDIYLSGFGDSKTQTWKPGDTVDIEVTQNGEYWNFAQNANTQASPDPILAVLKEISAKLDFLVPEGFSVAKPSVKTQVEAQGLEKKESTEIKVEDINF